MPAARLNVKEQCRGSLAMTHKSAERLNLGVLQGKKYRGCVWPGLVKCGSHRVFLSFAEGVVSFLAMDRGCEAVLFFGWALRR